MINQYIKLGIKLAQEEQPRGDWRQDLASFDPTNPEVRKYWLMHKNKEKLPVHNKVLNVQDKIFDSSLKATSFSRTGLPILGGAALGAIGGGIIGHNIDQRNGPPLGITLGTMAGTGLGAGLSYLLTKPHYQNMQEIDDKVPYVNPTKKEIDKMLPPFKDFAKKMKFGPGDGFRPPMTEHALLNMMTEDIRSGRFPEFFKDYPALSQNANARWIAKRQSDPKFIDDNRKMLITNQGVYR